MPSLTQLRNQCPASCKKRKICDSFLTNDSVSSLPPPMPSLTQLHNQCPAFSKKWKVHGSFLSDNSVALQPQIPEDSVSPLPPPMPSWTQLRKKHLAPSKKWKIPISFLSHDSVQHTQNAEDCVPSPMLNLTQMQYPDDSCVEGFAIGTPGVRWWLFSWVLPTDGGSTITNNCFQF